MSDTRGTRASILETVERLAVIVTALFILWQTRIIADHTRIFTDLAATAVKHYEGSLAAATTDRSSNWANRLREKDTWDKEVRVNGYLRGKTSEAKKIDRIEKDQNFKSDFYSVLAVYEDLAYLYNTSKVDKEFIKRGPSGAITQFYNDSLFWIEYRRRQTKNPLLWKEFEEMVRDISK